MLALEPHVKIAAQVGAGRRFGVTRACHKQDEEHRCRGDFHCR
jgi:hypothetical protein